MRVFKAMFSGELLSLDQEGRAVPGYLALERLDCVGFVEYGFLMDLAPSADDAAYWDRLYALRLEPHHLRGANAIALSRLHVQESAFAQGTDDFLAIARVGIGTDKIDLDACTRSDVVVFNAPDGLVHSTASAAMTLILAMAKKLIWQERMARSGSWANQADVTGDDITAMTLGLIGLGRVARELVRMVAPFEMNVIAFSPSVPDSLFEQTGVRRVDLERVFREADYVCPLCRLPPDRRAMITEAHFRMMKPTAYFINMGRGELVDEAAMIKALRERWIAGAALDVFQQEPLPKGHALMELDNVLLTPHWLTVTHRTDRITANLIADGILALARGQVPNNVVNADVLTRPAFQAKLARYSENAAQ
jgi:phosphoglycerate dehydrogenase-like enzyme